MRALMPALLIGTLVATGNACGEGLASEGERDELEATRTSSERGDASTRASSRVVRVTRPARAPVAQLNVPARVDASAGQNGKNDTGDAGPDSDAGADPQLSEFERAILYDCTETVLCNGPANSIPQCVVQVRELLNEASEQTRQVFLGAVGRCRPRQACDYVECVRSQPR